MTGIAATSPYPWPWDGDLDPTRLALVVAGWDDHWAAATSPAPAVLTNIAALAAAVSNVVVVAHDPPRRPHRDHADGHRRPARLPEVAGTAVAAAGVDAFYGSRLDAVLRRFGATHLLVTGLGLETTVHSTMRRANDLGLECLLITDACAAIDASVVPGAISSIEMSGGIFGAVGSTHHTLTALQSAKERE